MTPELPVRGRVRRWTVGLVLVLAAALVGLLATPRAVVRDPMAMTVASPAPHYGAPGLEAYDAFQTAERSGDIGTLVRIAAGHDYLAYRAARTVAERSDVDPVFREAAARRALDLRIDEPLARAEERQLHVELGALAERNGDAVAAMDAFEAALPEPEAVHALERLATDPYDLANRFLRARMDRAALDALGSLTAPSIEAPAHRRLGEHEAALDAYVRWLEEDPSDLEARSGVAWSHWYLGDLDAADAAFSRLRGANALYGRALIANRRGDLDRAVELLVATNVDTRWWLATTLLERAGRVDDAIDLYLRLARTRGAYADDAAFRALVLAQRIGRPAAADAAAALVPDDSFFHLRTDGSISLEVTSDVPLVRPAAIDLAAALARANDVVAAVGELRFALRDATSTGDVAAQVALGEALATLGDYRAAQRTGSDLLDSGVRDLRVWRLAYPRAFPDLVARESKRSDIEPALVWSIMRKESAFFPEAVSRSNAKGLMQVVPSTWDWLAELQDETPGNPFDPATNIRYGVHYLGWLFDYLGGDADLVISSYNRGQGYIKRLFESPDVAGNKAELYRSIDSLETREYLQGVAVNLAIYRALYGADPLAQLRR